MRFLSNSNFPVETYVNNYNFESMDKNLNEEKLKYVSVHSEYLTIPAVTVFWRESGQPRAITQSPGRSVLEIPSFAVGSGVEDLIFTIAISEWRSASKTVPWYDRPSCKVTSTCKS